MKQKKFYRISRERLNAYIDALSVASNRIKEKRVSDKKKLDRRIDMAWKNIIDVHNSLATFKNYEDIEVGGKQEDDIYIYDFSDLDNFKFYKIEFGIEK